jgi:hypothetical protein
MLGAGSLRTRCAHRPLDSTQTLYLFDPQLHSGQLEILGAKTFKHPLVEECIHAQLRRSSGRGTERITARVAAHARALVAEAVARFRTQPTQRRADGENGVMTTKHQRDATLRAGHVSPSVGRSHAFMNNRPVDYLAKFDGKRIGKARLRKERGTACTPSAFPHGWSNVACEHDDWDIPCSRLALQILNELPSVSDGQRQLRDDDIWARFPRLAKRLFTVARIDRLETEGGQASDVQVTSIVVLVDDEDQRPRRNAFRVTAVHGAQVAPPTCPRLSRENRLVC